MSRNARRGEGIEKSLLANSWYTDPLKFIVKSNEFGWLAQQIVINGGWYISCIFVLIHKLGS